MLTVSGIQELNNTYSYDILGRLETVSGSGVSAQYGYDVNGNRSAVVYGNGVSETYAYNKANLVMQVVSKKGTAILDENGDQLYYWTPTEKNWWITGFDPSHQGVSAKILPPFTRLTSLGIKICLAHFLANGVRILSGRLIRNLHCYIQILMKTEQEAYA